MPLGVFMGCLLSVIWFWVAKHIHNKDKMYIFNLTWDSMMLLIYYLLPLIFFGSKLDRWGWIGLGLITLGAVILRIKH